MKEQIQFGSYAGTYFRKMQMYMKRAFKRLDISFEDGVILSHVHRNPSTTQERIAESLVLDAAAVARSLKSLEGRGLISRTIDISNQRRKLVELTSAGVVLSEKINVIMQQWDAAIFQGVNHTRTMMMAESMHFLQQRAAEMDVFSLADGLPF